MIYNDPISSQNFMQDVLSFSGKTKANTVGEKLPGGLIKGMCFINNFQQELSAAMTGQAAAGTQVAPSAPAVLGNPFLNVAGLRLDIYFPPDP